MGAVGASPFTRVNGKPACGEDSAGREWVTADSFTPEVAPKTTAGTTSNHAAKLRASHRPKAGRPHTSADVGRVADARPWPYDEVRSSVAVMRYPIPGVFWMICGSRACGAVGRS